jgi:hypothetical protein
MRVGAGAGGQGVGKPVALGPVPCPSAGTFGVARDPPVVGGGDHNRGSLVCHALILCGGCDTGTSDTHNPHIPPMLAPPAPIGVFGFAARGAPAPFPVAGPGSVDGDVARLLSFRFVGDVLEGRGSARAPEGCATVSVTSAPKRDRPPSSQGGAVKV